MNYLAPPAVALVEIPTAADDWDLPEEYATAVRLHSPSHPSLFYLPWPVNAIPAEGKEIAFNSIARFSEAKVTEIEYYYHKEDVTVYIKTEEWSGKGIDLQTLFEMAELGFLFESRISITDAFTCAGLPSTEEKYLEIHKTYPKKE
ncbi:MAG: hypothetical protein JWL87_58 [Candidatus Adlerbacteria bacterium]|nr:hypothetical protein [Candidatus Adlerbacteria bacterium]